MRGVFAAVALSVSIHPAARASADAADPGGLAFDRAYARVLAEFVRDARVDYRGLKERPEALQETVRSLGAIRGVEVEQWPREEQLAFWINAYNVLTLHVVATHYPIKARLISSLLYPKNSIRQIPGAWDALRFPVAGREVTLDEIEHRILRAQFHEPRVHFALVCASRGCPPLRAEPYRGPSLDDQLENQVSTFLADRSKFRLDRARRTAWLSPIFKWFADDFHVDVAAGLFPGQTDPLRGALRFVSVRLAGPERRFLESESYDVRYLDYDWALNEAP